MAATGIATWCYKVLFKQISGSRSTFAMLMLPLQLVTVTQPRAARMSTISVLPKIQASAALADMDGKSELKYRDVIKITSDQPAQRAKKDILSVCEWIKKISPLFAGKSNFLFLF